MGTDDHAIGGRIDGRDEIGAAHSNSDPFALTDGEAFDTGMMAHYTSVASDDLARCICMTFLSNELSMLSRRHKTDFLTVLFVSNL